ncbi:MAG: hypothetical protein M1828_002567 [Chrysothrix sp. TS-e1954]|nr:MAG: hypothetical protein M1828_002567 [Chrysothrix sp. TS-e1954]
MDINGVWQGLMTDIPQRRRLRVLVIGAGSRGSTYARAIDEHTPGVVAAVADPVASKRNQLGKRYIWKSQSPSTGQSFASWQDYIAFEQERRKTVNNDELDDGCINAALICTLDTQHAEIIRALAPLKLHILCEKPLATTLKDCLDVYRSLQPIPGAEPTTIFAIAHVLRYTPHNILLRKLLLEDKAIGDILSIEHTEPVGYWHFSHSYVRGNWRKDSTTAPSLLTKSCHDIDFLYWMLCDSDSSIESDDRPRMPRSISSTGHLSQFRRSRKPAAAGAATNCLSCNISEDCLYSATRIYDDRHLSMGHTSWPVKIVDPEIEDIYNSRGLQAARARLHHVLAKDYDRGTPKHMVEENNWWGRCIWECDNDVCDDQVVTMTWDEDENRDKPAMTATFHMIASTEAQCARRGRIYGTEGEIAYDSSEIEVTHFPSSTTQTHTPSRSWEKTHAEGGHGGGDEGLAANFVSAVESVLNGASVGDAQRRWLGVNLGDIVTSHAMVFAAEEARKEEKIVRWADWWKETLVVARQERKRGKAKEGLRTETADGWQVI